MENKSLLNCCFNCIAKKHLNNMDLIIGDFWRYESKKDGFNDDKGLSAVVVLSKEGNSLWESVKGDFEIEESDYFTLSSLQWHLEHSAVK